MLPVKKILCPTDFSELSFEALEVAKDLAQEFSSELVVLHVVAPIPVIAVDRMSPGSFDVPAYQVQMEETSAKLLEEQIQARIPKKVSVRGEVVLGDPAGQIVAKAEEEQADLVVIATRGQTGLMRLAFGSVAEKVVRLAACPVLTIRGSHPEESK